MTTTSRSLTEGGTGRNIGTRGNVGDGSELLSGRVKRSLNFPPPIADSDSVRMTDASVKVHLDAWSGDPASPADSGENRPKGRKRRGLSDFIQRSWKSIQLPFLQRHRTRVRPFVPPVQPEQTPVPAVSSPEEHHTKGKKRRGVSTFFQATWKSVKRPFLHFHRTKVEPFVPPQQLETKTPDPEQIPVPLASSPEEEPDRETTSTKLSSATSSSWLEDSDSTDSESCSDTDLCESEEVSDTDLVLPEPRPVPGPSYFEPTDGEVDSHYTVGYLLGSGNFGMVHKGTRNSDGQKVAIKFMSKYEDDTYLVIPGHSKPLLTEVALMLLMKASPSPFVVQMFEWYEDSSDITIVMEYPHPCENLHKFIRRHDELSEADACVIMYQAVRAIHHCIDQGVFYTDIHTDNFVVNPCTLQLKLIDFGCGQLFSSAGYDKSQYIGARDYCPPEIFQRPTFHAVPANVWSLGLILYELVNGCLPYAESEEVLFVNPDLSRGWTQTNRTEWLLTLACRL